MQTLSLLSDALIRATKSAQHIGYIEAQGKEIDDTLAIQSFIRFQLGQ